MDMALSASLCPVLKQWSGQLIRLEDYGQCQHIGIHDRPSEEILGVSQCIVNALFF